MPHGKLNGKPGQVTDTLVYHTKEFVFIHLFNKSIY